MRSSKGGEAHAAATLDTQTGRSLLRGSEIAALSTAQKGSELGESMAPRFSWLVRSPPDPPFARQPCRRVPTCLSVRGRADERAQARPQLIAVIGD